MRKLGTFLIALLFSVPALYGASVRHVLMVVGISADEEYAKNSRQWALELSSQLSSQWRLGAKEMTLALPDEEPPPGPSEIERISATREAVQQCLRRLASGLPPDGEFFLYVFGSGSFDGKEYKLNLRGPDLSGAEIKELLEQFKCRRQALFWGTSSSGELLRLIGSPGRVIITATRSGAERNDPRFPGYFVASLFDPAADTDKDQRVSWLEAFQAAKTRTEQYFQQEVKLPTEHPQLDDDGDGRYQPSQDNQNGDGLLAASFLPGLARAVGTTGKTSDPQLVELYRERDRLEAEVLELRGKRAALPSAEYERRLEELVVKLARISSEIRKRESESGKP